VFCQGDGRVCGWKRSVCRTPFWIEFESKFGRFLKDRIVDDIVQIPMFWAVSTRFHREGPTKRIVRIGGVYVKFKHVESPVFAAICISS